MKKTFYSHLIELDELYIELDNLDISKKEREHLVKLAESSIHTTVMSCVIDNLVEDDKKDFIMHSENEDHKSIWNLISYIEGVEYKIASVAHNIRDEFISDIKKHSVSSTKK